MFDRTSAAQPFTPITMVGDFPVPVDPPPIPLPPLPVPTIPHIGNPVPYVVHGAEAAWSDVASWVSDRWHSLTGVFGGAVGIGWDEIKNFMDITLSAEQTAWASFISTLEAWINAGVAHLTAAVLDLGHFTVAQVIGLYDDVASVEQTVIGLLNQEVLGIEGRITGLEHLIEGTISGVVHLLQTWAIDNIYTPLLDDVRTLERDLVVSIDTIRTDVERYARDLVSAETLERIAAIAGIAAAVATITTWIAECGEPMCQELGPKTDLGKLLKALNLAADTLLLAELASLTEPQLVALIDQVASKLGQLVGDVETMFIAGGDTIGATITTELSRKVFG